MSFLADITSSGISPSFSSPTFLFYASLGDGEGEPGEMVALGGSKVILEENGGSRV